MEYAWPGNVRQLRNNIERLLILASGDPAEAIEVIVRTEQPTLIFYDNHGQWVTLRRALPHEIERAKAVIELREVLAGVPCKA